MSSSKRSTMNTLLSPELMGLGLSVISTGCSLRQRPTTLLTTRQTTFHRRHRLNSQSTIDPRCLRMPSHFYNTTRVGTYERHFGLLTLALKSGLIGAWIR